MYFNDPMKNKLRYFEDSQNNHEIKIIEILPYVFIYEKGEKYATKDYVEIINIFFIFNKKINQILNLNAKL